MSGKVAVVGTSVLISLQCTGSIGATTVLFARILLPLQVRAEIRDGVDRNHDVELALTSFAIFEGCNDYLPERVDLLLQDRASRNADIGPYR